jgi:hypothetical protein
MAWSVPRTSVILPNRILIREDAHEPGEEPCTGTVVRTGIEAYGPFHNEIKFSHQEQPTPGADPEVDSMVPGTVHTYTRVVFKRSNAQAVTVNGVDYFLVHANDILAFIPDD